MVRPLFQAKCFDHPGHPLFALFSVNPGQHEWEFHIFGTTHPRYQVKKLKDKTDFMTAKLSLLMIAELGHILIFKKIGAAVRPVQKADHVQQGRFS